MDRNGALAILGLEPGATRNEIKEAYLELVQVCHPDKVQGSEKVRARASQQMKNINAAYSFLKDAPDPEEQARAEAHARRARQEAYEKAELEVEAREAAERKSRRKKAKADIRARLEKLASAAHECDSALARVPNASLNWFAHLVGAVVYVAIFALFNNLVIGIFAAIGHLLIKLVRGGPGDVRGKLLAHISPFDVHCGACRSGLGWDVAARANAEGNPNRVFSEMARVAHHALDTDACPRCNERWGKGY